MSSVVVDKDGKRIDANILTAGYIRQQIEIVNKLLIPEDIKNLCFIYWYIASCDTWNTQFSNSHFEIHSQNLKIKALNEHSTAYGNHAVSSGVFSWKLRFNKQTDWFCVGIIEDNDELLKKHVSDNDYDLTDYGCFFFYSGVFFYRGGIKGYGEKFTNKDDEITVILDMDEKRVALEINGKSYGFAGDEHDKMEKDSYRLVVTAYDQGADVELL